MLRCWQPADAARLKAAVDSSLEHLRPWMPWAHEAPLPLEETVELLRGFRGRFDLGQDFVYGIFARDGTEVVGGTGLHTRRGDELFEIGYWIRASQAGKGLCTEATAALTRVGLELCGAARIEIRCDPANVASAAVPRKLGFREEGVLRNVFHGPDAQPRMRDAIVFGLLHEELAATPAAVAAVEAFDAAGKQVFAA